jgi:hypothetical protein
MSEILVQFYGWDVAPIARFDGPEDAVRYASRISQKLYSEIAADNSLDMELYDFIQSQGEEETILASLRSFDRRTKEQTGAHQYSADHDVKASDPPQPSTVVSTETENTYPAQSKVYSVPVFNLDGIGRLVLEVSVPPLPESLTSCQFAEHVFDFDRQESTDQLIVLGDGKIGASGDLGQNWQRIEPHGCQGVRFHNCFTTRSGRHLVQTAGWLGQHSKEGLQPHHGQIYVFSSDWSLLCIAKAGSANWHGSASIAEKNGVIMFAEYHDNSAKYAEGHIVGDHTHVSPCAIWRSCDNGVNWERVFEQSPYQIRHFHTLIADPVEQDVWWASSGDYADETYVWRSDDNGDTWVECRDPDPDVSVPAAFADQKLVAHRFTDAAVLKDSIIWGTDDLMGAVRDYNPALPVNLRAGSRLCAASKSQPLRVTEIGYIGHPIRSMIDVGLGWVLTTEAKTRISGYRASIYFVDRSFREIVKICDADNFRSKGTGLTYSKASRASRSGRFFSYKLFSDLFENSPRIAQYDIRFES